MSFRHTPLAWRLRLCSTSRQSALVKQLAVTQLVPPQTHVQPAGKGRLTAKDGGYYEGAWEAGERMRGREVSADARGVYDGEWRDGLRHGEGVQHRDGLSTYTGAARHAAPASSACGLLSSLLGTTFVICSLQGMAVLRP